MGTLIEYSKIFSIQSGQFDGIRKKPGVIKKHVLIGTGIGAGVGLLARDLPIGILSTGVGALIGVSVGIDERSRSMIHVKNLSTKSLKNIVMEDLRKESIDARLSKTYKIHRKFESGEVDIKSKDNSIEGDLDLIDSGINLHSKIVQDKPLDKCDVSLYCRKDKLVLYLNQPDKSVLEDLNKIFNYICAYYTNANYVSEYHEGSYIVIFTLPSYESSSRLLRKMHTRGLVLNFLIDTMDRVEPLIRNLKNKRI